MMQCETCGGRISFVAVGSKNDGMRHAVVVTHGRSDDAGEMVDRTLCGIPGQDVPAIPGITAQEVNELPSCRTCDAEVSRLLLRQKLKSDGLRPSTHI